MRPFKAFATDGICLVLVSIWVTKSLLNNDPDEFFVQFFVAPITAMYVGAFLRESWERMQSE